MKPARLLAVLPFFIAMTAAAQGIATDAQAVLDKAIADNQMAGLSAAILKDGEVIWTGGAGFADLENHVPATGDMVHRIASISKSMTAVATMQLIDEGKLTTDTTLRALVPDFPEKKWPIKVEHLLTHTSGIRHYEGDSNTAEHYPRLSKSLVRFQDSPLSFEPGTKYQYTTYGYTALGVMLEEADGSRFDRLMRKRIWEPAGMDHTDVEDPRFIVENRARPYMRGGRDRMFNAQYANISYKYPGGGIIATAGDLVRFAHAFYTHKLTTKESYELATTPYTLADGSVSNYGFGWGVGKSDKFGKQISHSGGQEGTSTLLVALPEQDIAVGVLSNVENTSDVVRPVLNALIGLAAKE